MAAAAGQRTWRVLVVDDEENLNWSLVTSLRKDNYAADGAATGEDALRRLASQAYDIVISDVKMPGMDGFELLQWLRANRPQTRIVMMTAFGSPTDRNEAMRNGVIAYLEKPFDLRALKEELHRLTAAPSDQRSSGAPASEGYDLLEVTRVINLARRDIALVVESNGRTGRLRFLRGDLLWAEAGDLQGDQAFVALTAPRIGNVRPEPWDGRSARNVTQPLSRLIFTALAQRGSAADAALSPTTSADDTTPMGTARTTPPPTDTTASLGAGLTPESAPGTGSFAASSVSLATYTPISPTQATAAGTVLDHVVAILPAPCCAALLRPDGALVTQRVAGTAETASGIFVHLAAAAQAALRALLLAGWGDLDDVRITSHERSVLVSRLGRTDRAVFLAAIVPHTANLETCRAALRERERALLDALR
jgi:CheY-like chemotaxis protein